jgi:cell shape-determining protein MreC
MPIARTHRVPVLLLGLLVATLLFPRACDEIRVAIGSLLPATVAPEPAPPARLGEEERARLQARVTQLEQELASRPAGDGALAGMRYVSKSSSSAPVAIACRVLHRETSSARRSLLVDAGRTEGVEPGMPVVQQDSLLGVVVTASQHAARVLRIDDRSAATTFPASILAAEPGASSPFRGQGVARGTGDGRLRVSFLASGGARVGDLVVTGAGSRLVPEGLVLG